jgi:hypothetical protein
VADLGMKINKAGQYHAPASIDDSGVRSYSNIRRWANCSNSISVYGNRAIPNNPAAGVHRD